MRAQRIRRQQHPFDRGASAVEYALMIAVFAAVVTVAVFSLGNMISTSFQQTQNCIAARPTPPDC